jgi:hypothetical protein
LLELELPWVLVVKGDVVIEGEVIETILSRLWLSIDLHDSGLFILVLKLILSVHHSLSYHVEAWGMEVLA